MKFKIDNTHIFDIPLIIEYYLYFQSPTSVSLHFKCAEGNENKIKDLLPTFFHKGVVLSDRGVFIELEKIKKGFTIEVIC